MSFKYVSDTIKATEVISRYQLTWSQKESRNKRLAILKNVFMGTDPRFLVIVGPCSAHDEDAVCDYVNRLALLQQKVENELFIVPRIYTNKPRTTGEGYKGMLYQPDIDNPPNILYGIEAIRKLHVRTIAETGLIAADEMLYPENLVFLQDLLGYVAIGARSVEDQQHRFVASGIDCPVGMKNPTSGDMNVLFNSILAAQAPQRLILNQKEVETSGNDLAHVVLRGYVNRQGLSMPNYHYEDLMEAICLYKERKLKYPFIVVDTNHDNSGKHYIEQIRIVKEVLFNRAWNTDIRNTVKGFMIESFIENGKQDGKDHIYGKSITDPCLGWNETEQLIYYIAEHI